MPTIPGFWDIGPHEPIAVEATWDEFFNSIGGKRVSELLPKSPNFDNADYLFDTGVLAELKEIETEFGRTDAFRAGFDKLMKRLVAEDPEWSPALLGGSGKYPAWFYPELIRIFRPPISRVLKKANRQLRSTKDHFKISGPTGILLFVNDGFTTIGPDLVRSLACDLLTNSYSSIDSFVYLTVNRYVEIHGSDAPRLVWAPTYSERAPDALHEFVNDLGRNWFAFLEAKIGPFTVEKWETDDPDAIRGAKAIALPK